MEREETRNKLYFADYFDFYFIRINSEAGVQAHSCSLVFLFNNYDFNKLYFSIFS